MEEPSASGAEGGAEEMEHDEADGEADVAPLSSNISLLLDLAQAQAEHGLRHGDYTRYRRVRPQLALRCQGARRSQLTRQPPPWCAGPTARAACTACGARSSSRTAPRAVSRRAR